MKPGYLQAARTLLGLIVIATTGCAEQTGSRPQPRAVVADIVWESQATSVFKVASNGTGPAHLLDPPVLLAEESTSAHGTSSTSPDSLPDEPFDPFAKSDEGMVEEYDPWEPFNTSMFEFNRQLDRFVLKPVATGYNFIVPDLVQVGISNIFYNLRFAPRLFNNIFQGKARGAGIEVGRFLVNSTVGVAGFFDVAKKFDLVTPEEDLGQTLGFYGVKPGPFLVLPFLPPFTLRDLTGYIGDIFLNPINWLVAPIIEVEGVPSAIAHKNRTTITFVQIGTRAGEIINERSRNLETFQGVEEATLDLYSAVRNAYLQKRMREIKE